MRWSRWGILTTAVLMGSGMMVSAWTSHSRLQGISETLTYGQGQILLAAVHQSLNSLGRRPEPEDLDRTLASFQSQGMRYLALPFHFQHEAGTAMGGAPVVEPVLPGAPPQLLIKELGERIRLIWRAPAPRLAPPRGMGPGAGPPPPGAPPRPPGGPQRPGDEPPMGAGARQPRDAPMVIEFEPVAARELVASSRRSLLISGVVSLTLLLAALAMFRWLKGREALQHQLERERHLATLGEMSAVLAHELRNPLASLKGHAQLLAEALPEGRSRTKAERVVKEALRMEDLTTSLLAFVRTGSIQRQETDPAAIVRAAAEEVDPRRIELDAGGAPGSWSLDAARMQQVLSNLLRNAVQASPEGAAVFARVATESGALLYEVRDVGTGIPPGLENVIFEPFHTQRPLGNGLGLAVARRVVELHGGSIQASNHPEGGALFRVRIPVAA
ncbi:sensor histidine kinase [Hyalangium rubrum]|uniref:histidine kinase n=1 Tax=Hyalangium rubrum TaxID=3103134 RepID=A0ABU5GZV4_9BACT|nr:ATP-binding protein [Hyalangium sp. s54d21]MDY7226727.1 ATP-binding protein [Hyalangium sp. s54d21]